MPGGLTQKELVYRCLEAHEGWVAGYRLRSLQTPLGFIGSSGDRRARELAEEGRIETRMQGRFVAYRHPKWSKE